MSWRVWLIVLGMACSTHAKRPMKPRNVSDDRASPHLVKLFENSGYGNDRVSARAPAAGTWWYRVIVPRPPDTWSRIEFGTSYAGGPDGRVTFSLVRDREVLHSRQSAKRVQSIELPESKELPEEYLLAVATSGAVRFDVSVSHWWRADLPPEPVRPPPDPVHPACDPNRPNFKNPRCCHARCSFKRLSCRAKVLSGGPRIAKISLSANDEIMQAARGFLMQGNNVTVSEVVVRYVGPTDSSIEIIDPDKVNMSTLLTDGTVILTGPLSCKDQSRP